MQFIHRMMYGRNGADQLCLFLILLYGLLAIIASIFDLGFLSILAHVPLYVSLFRMLSRNLSRRHSENARFIQITAPVQRWFNLQRCRRNDKEHCYFKCPNCSQQLRAPRGKGKITVHCRNCGVSFEEKT